SPRCLAVKFREPSAARAPFLRRPLDGEPYLRTRLRGGWSWRHQFPNGVKDNCELSVVLPLQLIDATRQILVRGQDLAKANERAHDRDVDVRGAATVQYAREHRDALFGEDSRRLSPTAASRLCEARLGSQTQRLPRGGR